ncbi:MAG: hypothetical protein LBI67_02075 [Treponema sp.]|jgi:hypothetical protein|nr:hypothetical protein [Treponema sp.]
MNDIVPVNEVAKRGVIAVGGIAGAVVLFILGSLPAVAGIIAGAVIGIVGIAALSSKSPGDKFPGFVAAAAGVLAIVSRLPVLGGLARFALGAGAAGLLALGVWNAIKFFKGMRSRS